MGRNNARERQNYSDQKIFLKNFFVEYLLLKNTQKNKKYWMEIMDGILAKPLLLSGFRGVDKAIFGCYNEVASRKNWCLQLNKKGCRVHKYRDLNRKAVDSAAMTSYK